MEHRDALIKNSFQVTTAVTGISEKRETKGKGVLKASALCHKLKLRN